MVLFMPAIISRWGNSLAVRIPVTVAEKAKISEGDSVEVSVSRQGRLIVESVRKEVDFGALYDQITPANRFEEVRTGTARGSEIVEW